jgi:hypothetical protein
VYLRPCNNPNANAATFFGTETNMLLKAEYFG